LDPWVLQPRAYEAEVGSLVRAIVRHDVTLFPGEAYLASQPRPAAESPAASSAAPSDLYSVYLREIRRIPRMERSEEFRYVLALEIAKRTLEATMRSPRPTATELDAMSQAVDSHDPTFQRYLAALAHRPSTRTVRHAEAAKRADRVKRRFDEMVAWKRVLVFRTLPLAAGMSRKYQELGVPLMDLIQEANAALMKATDRYEWRKGVRFVLYARWWVRQGVLKSLSSQSRTVRLPVYLAQKLKKIRDLNEFAYRGTGQRLSLDQLSAALDEPVERVQTALSAAKSTVSMDQDLDPRGDFVLRDAIADPRVAEVEIAPVGAPFTTRIDELLDTLSERERLVLELRYGLHKRPPQTLDSVSKRLGVSRERVRQIQEEALKKLQEPTERMRLLDFLPN